MFITLFVFNSFAKLLVFDSFIILFVFNSFVILFGIIVPDVFGTKISGPSSPTIDGLLIGGSPPSLKPNKPLSPRITPGPMKGLIVFCAKPAAP